MLQEHAVMTPVISIFFAMLIIRYLSIHISIKKVITMPNSGRKTIFTTISIDKETATLVEKICKRYSLKKSEVVKLAFGYIDKAPINPSEAPELVKSELAK